VKPNVFYILFPLVSLASSAQLPTQQRAGELSYATTTTATDYHFTFKIVLDCQEKQPVIGPVFIRDLTYNTVTRYDWTFDSLSNSVNVADPCIAFTSPPCYRIWYFHFDCQLPYNNGGYSALYLDCCRDYYQNLYTSFNPSIYSFQDLGMIWGSIDVSRPGAVYVYNSIAGVINMPSKFKFSINSSPVFNNNTDTLLYVCRNNTFEHIFGATDADGDSLSYSFTPPRVFSIAGGPPTRVHIDTVGTTAEVMYHDPYSAAHPLGPDVTIDTKTGMVSGQLHDTGSYLVTIGVNEYRNGKEVTLTPHTRDVVIKVYDCSNLPVPKAIIPQLINSCSSSIISFPNYSTPYHSDLYWDNNKYLWDLGDGDTAQTRYPVHTYDTGTFKIRLITMPGYRCADTAYSALVVYPPLNASFNYAGNCTNQPVKFTNTSATGLGQVNDLTWSFINLKDSTSFISKVNNPTYNFTVPDQTYAAILDVTTTKGCEARDTQYINIRLSPYPLSTHDTVLSVEEPYQLHANAGYDSIGSYVWSPAYGLDNPNSASPVATGTEDITYRVQMQNNYGCSLSDTVHIKYYKGPDIYVPNAFTPNGDGRNDIFRPFPVGIIKLDYFRVFNRWGGIMYQTQAYLQGWDGRVGGQPALPGTYIWEVRGKDYQNKIIFKRGTVLLIR